MRDFASWGRKEFTQPLINFPKCHLPNLATDGKKRPVLSAQSDKFRGILTFGLELRSGSGIVAAPPSQTNCPAPCSDCRWPTSPRRDIPPSSQFGTMHGIALYSHLTSCSAIIDLVHSCSHPEFVQQMLRSNLRGDSNFCYHFPLFNLKFEIN